MKKILSFIILSLDEPLTLAYIKNIHRELGKYIDEENQIYSELKAVEILKQAFEIVYQVKERRNGSVF